MRFSTWTFLCLLFAMPAFAQDDSSLSVRKTCASDAFVNDTFTSTITVTNTGSSPLTNIVVIDSDGGTLSLATLAAGASNSWTIPVTDAVAGAHISNVTAFADNDSGSAAQCTTNIWGLLVVPSADASYTRDWHWTLTKTSNSPGPITILRGASATVGFTITATPNAVDSAWKVSGLVTVHNPAPMSVTVTSLTGTPASLQCGGSAPYTITAGGDLVCTYSMSRSGPVNGTINATATLANAATFDGSADYTFGRPATELHTSASVVDSGANVANADNTSTGWSLVSPLASAFYTAPNGGSFACSVPVTNVSVTCDNVAAVINGASLFDGEHVFIAAATTQIYTGSCGSTGGGGGPNCTLGIGYWKTHAGFTGHNPDRVTPELPQSLGTTGGAKTVKVTTAAQAVNVLSFNGEASNGVNKLYAQLLAAKLNIFRGASPAAVSSLLSSVDTFLASNNSADWSAMNKTAQKQVNTWMSTLDQYNSGTIGPGACQ